MSNPTQLASNPLFQAVDNLTGLPLAGGKLYTYASGTLNPLATYSDPTLTNQNPNPVILDAYGQAVVWLKPESYRFDLYNHAGTRQALSA